MRVVKAITQLVYGFFAILFILLGGSVLLFNTGLLPTAAREIVLSFADNDLRILHVIQEWGNAHLLLGLVICWFIRHYDQSQTFHWLLTAYLAIDALIHWFHVAGPPESITGPIILTIPVVIFVALGLMRVFHAPRRPEPA
jgi:hypothetical protein